jgi:ATP-dependent Clp protease ATP-binding subunit ClpA
MNLSQDLQIALSVAVSEASRRGHEYAVLEHLLYALTLSEETAKVLRHAGADLGRLRERLDEYLEEELEPVPPHRLIEPRLSMGLQRALARAGAQVEGAGKDEVSGADLLVAIYGESDSYAARLLDAEGVTRLDVVSFLAHGVSKLRPALPPGGGAGGAMPAGEPGEEPAAPGPGEALEAFTQELTALARSGKIDPIVGRDKELSRTLHVLQRRRKNNPLYVGDPGVGKTALAEGLAVKIARGEVPEPFRKARIFRLDLGSLLAGTRYRGDFENRMKAVLASLEALATGDDAATPILFLDEIHTVIGAGSAGRGTLDASNLLKPALQGGLIRMIGATTWEEFRQSFERDRALARRFQKIEVAEPSVDETVKIFLGLKDRYEEHHGVTYTKTAVEAAAELASRYLRDRRLPDSALDLLDEAGSAVALARHRGEGGRVGVADLEKVLSTMAQIPERRVRGDDRERLARLEEDLKARVFGQAEAIERLVASIQVSRAGLREPDKPVGSFLLTGPTGVGKTETAKELARVMGIHFLRFDMSEYMERHTVSRLVGAPPGYVGYDRGGLLTEAVSKNPHAVLLLDEIEKAHEDVFNLLLQVMDHGTLTDTNGKQTDFRHVILLMTSNVGAREMARRLPGFNPDAKKAAETEGQRAVEKLFSPEFRNRLDGVLRFEPLSPEVMERIVHKLVNELTAQLAAKGVTLELTDAAVALLAERGYDPDLGARPLARVLDETLKQPLTREILFGRLEGGGHVAADAEGGEIVLR